MYKVVRTRQADTDLLNIWLYVATDNIEQADALLSKLDKRCQILSQYPEVGRKRKEIAPGVRSIREGNYQIFYRLKKQRVEVLRVIHGARDLKRIFQAEVN